MSFQPRLSLALALAGMIPPFTAASVRNALLRAGGITLGHHTGIGGRLWVAGGSMPASRLAVGDRCFINDGCRFDVSAPVTIGDDVYLGHEVAVLTTSHEMGPSWRRAGDTTAAPITIGPGAWVGARATILGGVTVGEGSIVAAGAVVTRSVEPNTLVGGVPAQLIRLLDG